MPGFYWDFTTTRTTEPDRATLDQRLRNADSTAGINQHVVGTPFYKIKKNSDWSPAQIAAVQNVLETAPESSAQLTYQLTSRQKDRLATIALIVRSRNVTAWQTTMTAVQKRDAVLAEADVWVNIREFIETNM